jgi:hypothetical protein
MTVNSSSGVTAAHLEPGLMRPMLTIASTSVPMDEVDCRRVVEEKGRAKP